MARFVHELSDWPQFTWDERTVDPLSLETRDRRDTLLRRMRSLGFDLRLRRGLDALVEEVRRSSEIEGERLDEESVRSSISRRLGIDAGGLIVRDQRVEGIVDLTLDAVQRCREPLTRERLFSWHASMFPGGRSGLSSIVADEWRDDRHGPMQVVSGPMGREIVHFEAPAADRVEGEMARFLLWFERDDGLDGILRAGLAHLMFVTIHPFDDGNGRIGRAITEMALARSENSSERFYSLSSAIMRERKGYYTALERTQRSALDATSWLVWFLDCLGRAVAFTENEAVEALAKARFWVAPGLESINPRQHQVLNRLLDGFEGKLTTSKWAKLTKCSQDTAYRDILDLVARGVLVRDEAGGRSTSYSLVRPFGEQKPYF